jgi:hypothetical protein
MVRIHASLTALAVVLCFTPGAEAQCINVDVGDPLSVGGVPAPTYAGGLSAGTWNPSTSATTPSYEVLGLLDCSGAATAANLSQFQVVVTNGLDDFGFDNPGTTGDDQALYDDLQDVGNVGAITEFTFSGLADGSYDVAIHAWAPDNSTFVSAVTPTGRMTQQLQGAWSGSPTAGVNYASYCLAVSGGTLSFQVECITGFASVNGIQIAPAAASCGGGGGFPEGCNGDGGNQLGCTDCPCGNNAPMGTIGGCLNSAGTSSRLHGSGTPTATGSNTTPPLRFECSGVSPSNSAQLTSGNAAAPANAANPCFGLNSGINSVSLDGLRCAVQSVLRHGVRPSDANGDVGITTNGWGGNNNFFNYTAFAAGVTKFFQVIHRDDAAAVCLTGQNTTQYVEVTFQP